MVGPELTYAYVRIVDEYCSFSSIPKRSLVTNGEDISSNIELSS